MSKLTFEEILEVVQVLENDVLPAFQIELTSFAGELYDRLQTSAKSEKDFSAFFTSAVSMQSVKLTLTVLLALTKGDVDLHKAIDKQQLEMLLKHLKP